MDDEKIKQDLRDGLRDAECASSGEVAMMLFTAIHIASRANISPKYLLQFMRCACAVYDEQSGTTSDEPSLKH